MLALLLGALAVLALLGGLRAFERASVASLKSLLAWTAALAGLSLALMLVLTGRGPIALFALSLLYPLLRERWQARQPSPMEARAAPGGRTGTMSRAEAFEILGLAPDASEAAIQEAYRRLMQTAHPDRGGSDWLAARINQARDVLLGKVRG